MIPRPADWLDLDQTPDQDRLPSHLGAEIRQAMNVPISEAKARLTDLVRRAEAGDEVVLTRHGRPVVRLAPVAGRAATELERNAIQGRARILGDA
jgi:prevent-host-death family protein